MPCPLGPTHLGVCQAECTPRKEGDRYYCDHASQLTGNCDEGPLPDGSCCQTPPQCEPSKQAGQWACNRGKCQEGPLPDGSCNRKFTGCQPVRGTLAMRRLTVIGVLGLSIGAILLMTGVPSRLALVSPGTLTAHHQGTEGCQDCHSVGEGRLVDWVHAAFSSSSGPSQTQLCLRCHTELGDNATFAHGLASEVLSKSTNNVELDSFSSAESLFLKAARAIQPAKHQELACKTCHADHHGEDFDMTQMANRECQVCHNQTFDSFHQGHPELTNFFYQRRTRLHFNHASHALVHFSNFERTVPNASETSDFAKGHPDCADCHIPDTVGRSMLTRGFEASCASCHEHQITDDEFPPINILRIPLPPSSDNKSEAMAETSSPENSPWHSPTPFMRLLLPDTPENINGMERSELSPDGVLSNLPVQQLLREMLRQDYYGMERRLRESLGLDEVAVDLALLAKTLTQLDFQRVDRQQLLTLIAKESGEADDAVNSNRGEQVATAGRSAWNLGRSPNALTLSYRPIGHADPFLKAWLEAGARHTDATAFSQNSEEDTPLTAVFRQLTAPTRAGRCLKCHTVGESADGHLQIEWLADSSSGGHREFTQFAHAPHLTLGQKTTCKICHPVVSELEVDLFKPEFVHLDNTINTNALATQTSGFHLVEKSICSKCHQPATAGDSCLMCHRYHIDSH